MLVALALSLTLLVWIIWIDEDCGFTNNVRETLSIFLQSVNDKMMNLKSNIGNSSINSN